MVNPTRNPLARAGTGEIAATGDWSATMTRSILQAQSLQWEALLAWQQSLVAFSMDLWEQWACRYAGGVPIDA